MLGTSAHPTGATEGRDPEPAIIGAVYEDDLTAIPLIGRTRELDQSISLLGIDRGRAVGDSVLVLGGDAGVGKTRFTAELRARAAEHGWRRLTGHCLDFGDTSLPYLPFSEILGRLEDIEPGLVEAAVSTSPAVATLLPQRRASMATRRVQSPGHGPDDSATSTGPAREEVFEAVRTTFKSLSEEGPILVVIEDLQWADASTRELLSYLFARGFDSAVVMVVTYRSDDLHRRHPLRPVLRQWSRHPHVTLTNLDRLPDADVSALVQSRHRAQQDPDDLRADALTAIVERAAGNAFYAEELLAANRVSPRQLPTELADLLLVRLDDLPDDALAVVRAAAAAGSTVRHATLAGVLDQVDTDLDAAIRRAVEANVLIASASGHYTFRHALLAEAIYDDLLPGERRRLHARYVTALTGASPGHAAELARHARGAADSVTAARASIEAARDAEAVAAPLEAAEHYLVALELGAAPHVASELDDSRTRLVRSAANALTTAGHAQRSLDLMLEYVQERTGSSAVEILNGEADIGSDLDGDHDWPELLVSIASVALHLDDPPVDPLAASTAALVQLADQASERTVGALLVHGRAQAAGARYEDAAASLRQAEELAERLDLVGPQAEIATLRGRFQDFTGDPRAALDSLTGTLAEARATGPDAHLIKVLHQIGGVASELGEVDRARQYYVEARSVAERSGRQWAPYGFDARVLEGVTAYMLGDWDAVARVCDLTDARRPPEAAVVLLGAVELQLAAGRGDQDGAARVEVLRHRWVRDGWAAIVGSAAAIDIFAGAGDLDGAEEVYETCVALVQRLWQVDGFHGQVRMAASLLGHFADAAATAGVGERQHLLERGERLGASVEAFVDGLPGAGRRQGPEGAAWTLRAKAEMLLLRWRADGQPPRSEGLVYAWQQDGAAFDALAHAYEGARSRVRLAQVLRALGEVDQAEELEAHARRAAEDLGARPLIDALPTRKRGVSERDRTARPETALTAREREVLQHVARGLTNGQIAQQLFITTKTVSVHVSNILAKLGAVSRTEAAAVAHRDGLLD